MGATPLWGPQVREDLEIWQDQAACKGADPVLFEILNEDHPASKGLDRTEQADQTRENFADAATFCERCPVKTDCFSNATEHDLDWTFRAGLEPRMFNGPPGRPSNAKADIVGEFKKCTKRGHIYDFNETRCPQCRATYKKWYMKKKRKDAKPSPSGNIYG